MYRLEWHVATSFMPLNSDLMSVCACALAQTLKTRLGDHHFNHKQVSDVYCVIRNSDSLQSCEISRLVSLRPIFALESCIMALWFLLCKQQLNNRIPYSIASKLI